MMTAALAGNPNVGKSTVFNALTGMKQHTGNWAGKTVGTAQGQFPVNGETVTLVDLPGIYSLACHSPEEEAARDYIVNERPDCVICVCDASALERNLILAGQLQELTDDAGSRLILCVNLIDEAEKRGIKVDAAKLSAFFGCPVILTAARQGIGLEELKRAVVDPEPPKITPCQHCEGCAACSSDDRHAIRAAEAVQYAVTTDSGKEKRAHREERWDRFLCGRFTSIPVMLFLIAAVFWLTLSVSARLSDGLGWLLDFILGGISSVLAPILPEWLWSLLCGGILATVFRVTAVMLPPMAVFFPAFTLLEDLGYLPRAAFCLDRCFAACGSCGKQSLTMLMGKFRVSDGRRVTAVCCCFFPGDRNIPKENSVEHFCNKGSLKKEWLHSVLTPCSHSFLTIISQCLFQSTFPWSETVETTKNTEKFSCNT